MRPAATLALLSALCPGLALAQQPPSADAAARIIGGALSNGGAMKRLSDLCDGVGPRLTGSSGAAAAVAWAEARFKQDGVSVHLEKVMVPHWVRGNVERGEIVARPGAAALPLALTALGGSGPTPEGGLTAEVVEVRSLAEVRALGDKAKGKIILFQHNMTIAKEYGEFGELRGKGPIEAQKAGAVAALVRSLATASFRSPHTGMTRVDAAAGPFPSAAVSTEDSDLLHRLLESGPVHLKLQLSAHTLPDVESHNVVAEVRGREKPDEIVLIGAHLDSWDLAQGAVDDGAGVAIVMESLRLIAKEKPRRTVRAVLFMNEENGLRGGEGYAKDHAGEVAKHVAALEADSGAGRPQSVQVHGGAGSADLLRPWLLPLSTLGAEATADSPEAGGADISPLARVADPVAMVSVRQDSSRYFDLHHSAADTVDKVKPFELAQATAAFAWTTFALAEMPGSLPRPEPKPARQ
jgi:Zn-dependent M28 family amino/carboxypeptidase